MRQGSNPSPKSTIIFGLIAASIGVFYILLAGGIFGPIARQPDQEAPAWLGIVVGLIFLLGGSAVVIQTSLRNANASRQGLPAATPFWLRSFYQLLCLGIVASLGVVATWVAFGPGKRTFTGSGAFLGEVGGRAAFGIGAVLIWIVLAPIITSAIHRQR
jgi:hypothetical protein